MAESTDNVVMYGMRGLIGKMLIFKNFFGKTIVARRPKKRETPPTADQLEIQDRFKLASVYAKNAIQDATLKAEYAAVARPGQTAYNIAFADFFKGPELSLPNIGGYSGQPGQLLTVRAVDNFRVVQVAVTIMQSDGTIVEAGDAVIGSDGLTWRYTTTQPNNLLAGSKIHFTAADLPGNFVTLQALVD